MSSQSCLDSGDRTLIALFDFLSVWLDIISCPSAIAFSICYTLRLR
ncbi:MAG TPA: hypothetical protein V6D25_20775 [Leptolyngbyaceae cyanobacterium]